MTRPNKRFERDGATGFARKHCTGVPDISLTEGKTARAGGYHRYKG